MCLSRVVFVTTESADAVHASLYGLDKKLEERRIAFIVVDIDTFATADAYEYDAKQDYIMFAVELDFAIQPGRTEASLCCAPRQIHMWKQGKIVKSVDMLVNVRCVDSRHIEDGFIVVDDTESRRPPWFKANSAGLSQLPAIGRLCDFAAQNVRATAIIWRKDERRGIDAAINAVNRAVCYHAIDQLR